MKRKLIYLKNKLQEEQKEYTGHNWKELIKIHCARLDKLINECEK